MVELALAYIAVLLVVVIALMVIGVCQRIG
jgi:hypothetical protein